MYEIAHQLKIPVYVLENEMPAEEFKKWAIFFQARPIGWREDQRTSILAQVSASSKLDTYALFPSLKAVKDYNDGAKDEEVMSSSLASSVFGARLSSALNKKK